jgi:flavin reductase (DIM6/NTAB) family NADH-FMN oxidoreductase RutF
MIGSEQLRDVMRHWTTGVTVVSSLFEGVQHGMTVSSFTSVSLDPPLVLVSLERGTRTHELVTLSGCFGVTILSELQQEISERFAGRQTELQDRFAGLNTHTLVSGVPFLEDGLAFLDCKVIWNYESATNTLFVGEVMSALAGPTTASPQHPLLYFNRAYRRMCD